MNAFTPHIPAPRMPAYTASDFCVVSGVNEGDELSFADHLILDDVYRLNQSDKMDQITIQRSAVLGQVFIRRACLKRPQTSLHLDCVITLMGNYAHIVEALVLVDVDTTGHVEHVYIMPLGLLEPDTDYRLVGVDRDVPAEKLATMTCVSLAKGTRITLANGLQRPIESLSTGDAVLTRDDGGQPIRWIGQSTQRADGVFAPIHIASGTLNNANDLIVSPNHRFFVHHSATVLGTAYNEALVRARDLVNGTTVKVRAGGFIEYYQLFFDRRQIVYAEGIAAETSCAMSLPIPPPDRPVTDHMMKICAPQNASSATQAAALIKDRIGKAAPERTAVNG